MRTLPQYWLYGLLVPKDALLLKGVSKKSLRRDALSFMEANFFQQSLTGGKRAARELDKNSEHFSMVECEPKQIMDVVKVMMSSGFDLSNLDEIFYNAPLPEFKTVVKSGRRNVEIIFTRPTTSVGIFGGRADCLLDVHFVYSRIRQNSIRIARIDMNTPAIPYDSSMFGLYTESMNPGKNINYYQDTGIRLFTLYIAIQYALLCSNDSLLVTDTRFRYILASAPSKEKYHRVMLHDFKLCRTLFNSPVLARNVSKKYLRCRRLLSKKDWQNRLGIIGDTVGDYTMGFR